MLEIRELDATVTEGELVALTDLRNVLDAEVEPDDPPGSPDWFRALLYPGNDAIRWHHLAAYDGARPVALAELELLCLDTNRHLADTEIRVHPDHRRRGVGTALVAAVAELSRADSRSTLLGFGPTGEPAAEFWTRFSMELAYRERLSRLPVAEVDADLMARWIADAEHTAPGYRLVRWEGAAPDEWAVPMQIARNAINDAPTDDLDIGDYHFDVAWQRAIEDFRRARRRRHLTMIAVDDSGAVAGLTELSVEVMRRWHALQGDTVVAPPHRGRGIGRWLKAAMWEWVRSLEPELRYITTYNAESNEHMLAINVDMGFRPRYEIACYQGPIP